MKNMNIGRKSKREERLGERKKMKNGQYAKIIEYKNSLNIVIQFDDGKCVNTRYEHFCNGSVQNPNDHDIVGNSLRMKNGMMATIIACRTHDDIDIRFEDGVVVEHKNYSSFRKHEISHPEVKTKRTINDKGRLGETRLMNNGQYATIIVYRKYDDIDVQFEDGYILRNRGYYDFQKGNMKNKNCITKKPRDKSKFIGKTNIMSNGQEAEIIEYNNSEDISVRFEDGYVAEHRYLTAFWQGQIKNPNKVFKRKVLDERVGEENIMNNGQKATIIRYGTSADIDVQFEDGYIKYNTDYRNFLDGAVANPNDVSKGTSLQEFAIMYYLRKYGFYKHEDRIDGKRFELDVYNPNVGGIEYDGRVWHLGKEKRDNQKSEYFFNRFGHKLIHIREKGLLKLDDKYSVNYMLDNDKPLSREYEKLLKDLLFNEFGIAERIDFTKDKKSICEEFYAYCHHLEEKMTMHNGQISKIIAYRGSSDIDVQFEDGTIVEHRQYSSFRRGTISNGKL